MRSCWLEEALSERVEDTPPVAGDLKADICIVGGGYLGLWTALRLKEREPSLDVAIVEGDICGGGASGRNGGIVASWWAKFNSLQKLCVTDEAVRLATASANAVSEIGAFCQAHEIDAHYRNDGWLWTATSAAQDGSWQALLDHLARHQLHPFEEWPPEQVARRAGSARHLSGVFEPIGATVQPALLARGLRRVAMAKGVRIYEHSPMKRLKRSSPPRVITKRGSVTAEKVITAMNAWAAALPELRRSIVVVSSDIVATEPMPARLAQAGWDNGMAISDSRMLLNYYRTTLDGRIAFGTGGGLLSFGNKVDERFEGTSRRAGEVERFLRRLYPDFDDVPVAKSWTGPIDRSVTGIPFFGRLDGRADLLYGLGFSGNGVGPTVVGGRIMASLALESDDEWADCGLVAIRSGSFRVSRFAIVAAAW